CELEAEARVGGEGQGLTIIQATLDILRLPAAAACGGLAHQSITTGTRALLKHGIGGRPFIGEQGSQWALAELLSHVEAADALVWQAAWARDTTSSRYLRETSMARMMAQDAAERACLGIADLVGLRGQGRKQPWPRLLAEVRALRLETELLENPRTVIARALLKELSDPA
ncbi:MAG: acyl-CoA dehydrogenase family protein, partial [Myxococcota bacterium]